MDSAFWDQHYGTRRTWDTHANPLLVETAGPLPPGAAADLGCGAGGDTVWLARHGWQVTAVDISGVAVEQVRARAREAGVDGRVTAEQHDLAGTFPAGTFDLVSAQYLQTPFPLDRGRVLRTAVRALRPGGLLLVVDHGSIAPWSWNQDPETHFPTPDEIAADLDLSRCRILRADMPRREATGPSGETATVTDNVLLIQRSDA
ncbi:SAM-dependent methyltransferase [Dactylosporangium siamense]|uniref:Methyltransferase n=1 Tax=Dactylosporangium siamense TaxID=685454 RepID=A0A919U5Z9_9ACTN|nr:class I SAM-dependent methyltransferase [Dactylosporangium siamense]GIG43884.1 methyltransferase [Dactylosporangium siamense]